MHRATGELTYFFGRAMFIRGRHQLETALMTTTTFAGIKRDRDTVGTRQNASRTRAPADVLFSQARLNFILFSVLML